MTTVLRRSSVFALALTLLSATAFAANPMLGEVRLEPASRTERDAGVWVDGQYLGFVKELNGRERLMLLPGSHEIRVRLAGFEDSVSTITVAPAEKRRLKVSLTPAATASYPDAQQTATVRVSVEPARAALFVDDVYAGPVERFSERGGVRIRAGKHRIRIELPGYRTFETEVTLAAQQHYEIKTELAKGASDNPTDLAARN